MNLSRRRQSLFDAVAQKWRRIPMNNWHLISPATAVEEVQRLNHLNRPDLRLLEADDRPTDTYPRQRH
jgi:hypothetical protein